MAFDFPLMRKAALRLAASELGLYAAIVVVLMIVAAFSGPFGTYFHGPFLMRLLYWAVGIGGGIAVARTVRGVFARWLGALSYPLREPLILLAVTAIYTPLLQLWTVFLFEARTFETVSFWQLAAKVLAVCIMVSVMRFFVSELIKHMPAKPTHRTDRARLLRRLPDDADQTVLRLSAEGHIVHVVMEQARYALRMRFGDAVNEMDAADGFCTHRSHWVARVAIAGTKTCNGRPVLVLSNGDEVPVSRKYQPELEAAGIL